MTLLEMSSETRHHGGERGTLMGELASDLLCRIAWGATVGAVASLAVGGGWIVLCGLGIAGSLADLVEGGI